MAMHNVTLGVNRSVSKVENAAHGKKEHAPAYRAPRLLVAGSAVALVQAGAGTLRDVQGYGCYE